MARMEEEESGVARTVVGSVERNMCGGDDLISSERGCQFGGEINVSCQGRAISSVHLQKKMMVT